MWNTFISFLPNEAKASPLLGDVIFSYPSGQLKWGLQQVEEELEHTKIRNCWNPAKLWDRQNMVQLPLCWQHGMPKSTVWYPKTYTNKCSIPVRFCTPFCYLDKHYCWPQWELSPNQQCVALFLAKICIRVFISKTLHKLYTHKTISGWRKQKTRKQSVGYLQKERKIQTIRTFGIETPGL